MDYDFNILHLLIALVIYGGLGWLCKTAIRSTRAALLTFVAVAVLVNAITFVTAYNPGDDQGEVRTREAAAALGLNSGTTYPLIVDASYEGVDVSGGYFAPAPYNEDGKVAMSFRHGDDTFIIKVDPTEIDFDSRTDVAPSVTINLKDARILGWFLRSYGVKMYDHSRPCQMTVATAFLACDRVIPSTVVVDEDTRQAGLHPLVRDNLADITVVMSPATFDSWIMQKRG